MSRTVTRERPVEQPTDGAVPFRFDRLPEFIGEYQRYVDQVLTPLRLRLIDIFDHWRRPEHWHKLVSHATAPIPAPVQRCRTRVKEPKAVVRKIMAKPDLFPDGLSRASLASMTDSLGCRVVVYFLSSLPLIDREIRESGVFEISTDKPPCAYLPAGIFEGLGLNVERKAKLSGYSSVHYVLRLTETAAPDGPRPWFELQLRTLTQDLWAEIEHLLGYKHRFSSPQVRGQFQFIASLLATIDENFDQLRFELSQQQTREAFHDDEPLNADNLPGVLSEGDLSCSQYDIKGLLKMAASCGIATVNQLRAVITTDNLEAVREAGAGALGRRPSGSELVVALFLLFGPHPVPGQSEVLNNWAAFNKILGDV